MKYTANLKEAQLAGGVKLNPKGGEVTEAEAKALEKEKRLQQAMLEIKRKYGKNAILHGSSYREEATGRERNEQVGGHRA